MGWLGKVTFEQRDLTNVRESAIWISEGRVSGNGDHKCKGPGAGA